MIKTSAVGRDEEMKTCATPQPPRGNAVTASQIPRNILTALPPPPAHKISKISHTS